MSPPFKNWIFALVAIAAASLIAGAVFADEARAVTPHAHVYSVGGAGNYRRFILTLDPTKRYELRYVAGPSVNCDFTSADGSDTALTVGGESGNTWLTTGRKSLACEVDGANAESRLQTTVVSVTRIEDLEAR